jgi:hypothetical protein
MQHHFSCSGEDRAGKIEDLAAIGLTAYDCVKKQIVALHHDRNLNVVAFGQDHFTIEFLKEYPIIRKLHLESMHAAMGFQGALNELTVRASPYEVLLYRFSSPCFLNW